MGPRSPRRFDGVAFPVVLWLAGCAFRHGDLGRWLDDWLYVQRFAATGEIRSLVLDTPVHFWRPLYRVLTPTLATLLWQHDQIHHLLLALIHALNTWLVWSILRDVGVRRLVASLSALMVLAWVGWVGYEVVFWLSALPTSLAVAIALATIRWTLRHPMSRWPIAFGGVIALIAFAAACLNEQPATLLAAVPVLLMGRGRIWRAAAAAIGLGVGLGAAAAGHAIFSPAPASMSGQGFLTPIRLWHQSAGETLAWFRDWALRPSVYLRALDLGWAEVREGSRGVLLGVLLVAAFPAWVLAQRRDGHQCGLESPLHARRGRLGVAGLVMAVASLAPIIVTSYWPSPRLFYTPLIGVVIAIAVACDAMAGDVERAARRHVARTVIASIGATFAVVSSLAMVGTQRAFAQNARFDRDSMERVASLVPSGAELPVLVPVEVEFRVFDPPPRSARAARFDERFYHVFWGVWSQPNALRLALRRDDVGVGFPNHRARRQSDAGPWRGPTLSDDPIPGGSVHVNGVGRVAWDRVIAFRIDAARRVWPIGRVEWVSPDGQPRGVDLPKMVGMEGETARFEPEQ